MKIIKKLLLLFLLLGLLLGAIGLGYYFAVTKSVYLDEQKLLLNEKRLLLYDKNGDFIENVSAFPIQQTVSIAEIPDHTLRAFIDTEDKRFFTHNGFDYKRILRATLNNVKSRSFKEGASTISQQLIKNTHLSNEKTIKRKLKEWKLTKALEKRYSKEEILEKYLNSIYFGHHCYGLQCAAEFYFSKSPSELDLAESAILAGLIKSPNNYSPFNNQENCKKRKECVLFGMLKNGSISEEEKSKALEKELPIFSEKNNENEGYFAFVFNELSTIMDEKDLSMYGNIEVFTGMDPLIQKELETLSKSFTESDKTLLVLDASSGDFKGCVSSVGNVRRLPGSLIKPLVAYAPAFEEDILVPATPILDEKVDFNGYKPENHDKKYHGYLSARECIAKSYNIPAIKTLQSLGVKKGVSYLQKVGLSVEEDDASLALALGGMKKGFALRDMLAAYSVFPNQGKLKTCGFIKEIKINGQSVYRRLTQETSVFSEESAYLMTDTLKSVVSSGTAKKLHSLPFEVAAKTGTVGNETGNTDAYTLSYTSKDLVGVWIGNADNSLFQHTGGGLPCNLSLKIHECLERAYKRQNKTIPPFIMSDKLRRVSLDKPTYYATHTIMLADDLAPLDYRFDELFKKEALPLKKSSFFSHPTIPTPLLTLENDGVKITLPKNTPSLYSFSIDRFDYVTRKRIYQGAYKESFLDDTIEPSKTYLYSVTPYYNGTPGTTVTLPAIHTEYSANDEIKNKDWWNY